MATKKLQCVPLAHVGSSGYNPKEWEQFEEIKAQKPKRGFVEVSLQRISIPSKTVNIVQWMGAKNGKWYPASDFFVIMKDITKY
jgi:hypothetical protein